MRRPFTAASRARTAMACRSATRSLSLEDDASRTRRSESLDKLMSTLKNLMKPPAERRGHQEPPSSRHALIQEPADTPSSYVLPGKQKPVIICSGDEVVGSAPQEASPPSTSTPTQQQTVWDAAWAGLEAAGCHPAPSTHLQRPKRPLPWRQEQKGAQRGPVQVVAASRAAQHSGLAEGGRPLDDAVFGLQVPCRAVKVSFASLTSSTAGAVLPCTVMPDA